ncbi:hypothetical protein [Hyphomonas sp. CY54-11-8]|uniref:hypothetical protein n=1 Tax=Hyphomonas sp. CY54-11-8 TaxID=1280944 RepID=UPI000458F2D4|nr:hypothetical protein [Hyphomonas sp. CY54-11-8]KCZ47788.1 hypothetical protein HY17_04745 [Hyphomonas sp. CY54-11-8]
MPFYVTAWNWLAKNPVAQGIAAAIGVVLAFMFWLAAFHDPRIRREARAKAEKAARKAQTKAIREIEEEADERIEKAKQARASVPDTDVLDSMSDDEYEFLFGRKRNG